MSTEPEPERAACPRACEDCGAPCSATRPRHRKHVCAECAEPTAVGLPGSHVILPVIGKLPFSYAAEGSPGHGPCCDGRGRVLYQGEYAILDLPLILARVSGPDGTEYLLSAAPGARPQRITVEDIWAGLWATRLGIKPPSSPNQTGGAAGAIFETAHESAVPLMPIALRPSDRDGQGRIPVPFPGTLPDGYLETPPALAGETPPAFRARMLAAIRPALAVAAACPRVALAVGLSAGGVYVGPVGHHETGEAGFIHLHGAARLGKTSTMELCASLWGRPSLDADGMIDSWDATSLGMGRSLGDLGIFPAFMDESGTSNLTSKDIFTLIMRSAQGNSRKTSSQRGRTRRTPGWRGLSFSSGNAPLSDEEPTGKFAGVPARLLNIEPPFTRNREDAEILSAGALASYGWLGPEVLRATPVDEMRSLIGAALAEIGAPDGGVRRSVALRLALGVAGAGAIDRITGSAIRPAALAGALELLGIARDSVADSRVILDRLAEDMTAHRSAWPNRETYQDQSEPRPGFPMTDQTPRHGVDRVISGVIDDGFVFVLPAWWRAAVESANVSSSQALGELHAAGALAVPASRRAKGEWTAKPPRWLGGAQCYKIRLDALAPESGEDDAEPGPEPEPEPPAAGPEPEPEPPAAGPEPEPEPEPEPALWPADGSPEPEPEPAGWAPPVWKTAEQADAYAGRTALLDQFAAGDLAAGQYVKLRLLGALEGESRRGEPYRPGPFTPARGRGRERRSAMMRPWRNGLPDGVARCAGVRGWNWTRPGFSGKAVTLDRSGAFVAAATSVTVAHGELTYRQDIEIDSPADVLPGYYRVVITCDWPEDELMPSPIGSRPEGDQIWLPAPTVSLLAQLADAGRWPTVLATEAYTGEPVRLNSGQWATWINALRGYAITMYGRDSAAYRAVKDAYSTSLAMMQGRPLPDGGREWPHAFCQRRDWMQAIESLSAANMWRTGDEIAGMLGADGAPVGFRNTDEMLIPAGALPAVTSQIPAGRNRPPVKIDARGIELGTFKVKGTEIIGEGE